VNGFPPPSPYQSIDTLKIAQRQFGFTHNGLDALARVFGLKAKLHTTFQLWKDAKSGDDKALKFMEEYNRGDVELLEEVYLKIRPWIKSHPNLALYVESEDTRCPHCGSSEVEWTGKFYYTQTGKYETFRCGCGAYGRSRKSSLSKEVKENLGVALAR
jgi:hypothetical protein